MVGKLHSRHVPCSFISRIARRANDSVEILRIGTWGVTLVGSFHLFLSMSFATMKTSLPVPAPSRSQGEKVDVPVGVGTLYLFCFDQPAATNPHFAKPINDAKYGAKPGRIQGNAAAMYLNFDLSNPNAGYDAHCIYWEDLEGPYDQVFIVGPFYQDNKESMAELERAWAKFIECDVLEYTMIASP